jgi:hypothetical protein
MSSEGENYLYVTRKRTYDAHVQGLTGIINYDEI